MLQGRELAAALSKIKLVAVPRALVSRRRISPSYHNPAHAPLVCWFED
jgi:hypothetical protein